MALKISNTTLEFSFLKLESEDNKYTPRNFSFHSLPKARVGECLAFAGSSWLQPAGAQTCRHSQHGELVWRQQQVQS